MFECRKRSCEFWPVRQATPRTPKWSLILSWEVDILERFFWSREVWFQLLSWEVDILERFFWSREVWFQLLRWEVDNFECFFWSRQTTEYPTLSPSSWERKILNLNRGLSCLYHVSSGDAFVSPASISQNICWFRRFILFVVCTMGC